jgi:hypothetical protein
MMMTLTMMVTYISVCKYMFMNDSKTGGFAVLGTG